MHEIYQTLVNQLNLLGQAEDDSGVSIEMESGTDSAESDNHEDGPNDAEERPALFLGPFHIMNGDGNEVPDTDSENSNEYTDDDSSEEEVHGDDVLVPGPAAEILFPDGVGIIGRHNPNGFDAVRGDVYNRTGAATLLVSRVVEHRWLDGKNEPGVPCFMRLQFEDFLLSVHCQLFHTCGPLLFSSCLASTTHRRAEFRGYVKRLFSESTKILTKLTSIASRCRYWRPFHLQIPSSTSCTHRRSLSSAPFSLLFSPSSKRTSSRWRPSSNWTPPLPRLC